jgi:hypothetical protein
LNSTKECIGSISYVSAATAEWVTAHARRKAEKTDFFIGLPGDQEL